MSSFAVARRACIGLMLAGAGLAGANAQDAAALRARHAELQEKLANNALGRPLVLESMQSSGALRGDVYAVSDYPFQTVQQSLQTAEQWCDILILHLNVKRCRMAGAAATKTLNLNVARKFDQPLEDAYQLDFAFRVAAAGADYLQVQLKADEGPYGTRDYRIVVEATPLDARRSFVHMSYAHGYGMIARMALQAYLATLGQGKVGFTVVDRTAEGQPVYQGGVLGLLERNTMRYYLALDAYLAAASLPAGEQAERRIREWYQGTQRYAVQLHEMEWADYLEMKRREIRRQQQPPAPQPRG